MRTIFLLFITCVLFFSPSINAETASNISIELIDGRIQTLRDTGGDDEVIKTYKSARDFLESAASYDSDYAQYINEIKNAPKRQAEILLRVEISAQGEFDPQFDLHAITAGELEAQLTILQTQLSDATSTLDTIDGKISARETNAQRISQRIDEIAERLKQLPDDTIIVNIDASPSLIEASKWVLLSERIALNSEKKAQQSRLASQPARYSVLHAERAEIKERISQLTTEVHAINSKLAETELEAADISTFGIDGKSVVYGIAQTLIEDRTNLRQQRVAILEKSRKFTLESGQLKRKKEKIIERLSTIRRMVDFAGESDVIGTVLLAHWREINSYQIKNPAKQISNIIANIIIERIGHEEEEVNLFNAKLYIESLLKSEKIGPASITDEEINTLTELARSKRTELWKIINDNSDYLEILRAYGRDYLHLVALIDEYKSFVGSRILWVPSRPNIFKYNFRKIPSELEKLFIHISMVRINPFPLYSIFAIIIAIFIYLRRSLLTDVSLRLNKPVGSPRIDSIAYTLGVLGISILRALPVPLVIWAIGDIFHTTHSQESILLSSTLQALAFVSFLFLFIQIICEKNGLGSIHFNWGITICDGFFAETKWLLYWWLPIASVTYIVVSMQDLSSDKIFGHILFLLVVALFGVYFLISLRRDKGNWVGFSAFFKGYYHESLLLTFTIITFVILSLGYVYTIRELLSVAVYTLFALILILIIYGTLNRWILITRRRIRLNELIAERDISKKDEFNLEEEDRHALSDISEDISELLKVSMISIGVLMLLYIWAPYLPAFNAFGRIILWTTTAIVNGETVRSSVSLQTILIAIFVLMATFYSAGKIPALIELILRRRAGVSASVGYTISTLLNYFIIGAGLIFVLSSIGLQWSKLQWLVAALGVGIGFGLQEIVANFISGLIILFERPIRLGDFVTIGSQEGVVTKIRIRATTIKDLDGKELLVPNKEFITGQLLNWTLSDSTTRIVVNVGVAYGTNIKEAIQTLEQVVKEHQKVLENPSPSIIFNQFGDNALNLAVRCFISSVDDRMRIVSELHQQIYDRFEKEGIVIAFPQRDIHFDSENPIRVTIDQSD